MGVEELVEIVDRRKKLRNREFWEGVVDELSEEELSVLSEVVYSRIVRRARLKVWIKSRVEREPSIKFERLAREVEKIFRLPLSYDTDLRREVWKEFRRHKKRIRERQRRRERENET